MPDVPSFAMRHVPVVPFAMAQESRKGFAIYTSYDASEHVDRHGEQVRGRRRVANLYGYSVSPALAPPGWEAGIVVPG